MLNFEYSGSGVTTKAIWPEVTSSYATDPSASFVLTLAQELDRSETELIGTLINNPTSLTPRLILTFNRADIPEYTGQYDATLNEGYLQRSTWGTEHTLWSDANWKWSAVRQTLSGSILLDTDRAWVSGSDIENIIQYYLSSSEAIYDSGSSYPAVEYISADEDGTYNTYHN